MGTSGAFGGSETKRWKKVREILDELEEPDVAAETDGPADGEPSGQDPPAEEESDRHASDLTEVIGAIADALQADDPAIRPRFCPKPASSDSGLSFADMAGTRHTGSTRTPPPGRRQVAQGAGRAGRAVGAGFALATGNGSALAEYGLSLSSLAGKSRVEQVLAILDELIGPASGPDDAALRRVASQQLNRILDETVSGPSEALRDLAAGYAFELALIEIEAWATKQGWSDPKVIALEEDIKSYIEARVRELDLSEATLVSASQFEHAAREILRALLHVLPREVRE